MKMHSADKKQLLCEVDTDDTKIDLSRFTEAQETHYAAALNEIKKGHKRSHWMWYIFPQIDGLGHSSTAKFYAIKNKDEAIAYRNDSILGTRLIEISKALLQLDSNNATEIMGSPDDLKLRSSMTLFSLVSNDPVFQQVLDKYFDGKKDEFTVNAILKK